MSGHDEAAAIEARHKYVEAWNDTMITMWKEQVTALEVIDTGLLLNSIASLPVAADGRFLDFTLSQQFQEYGIWQEYGVGKEVYRGNPGDIGRQKVRERRRWFSKKYYQSVMEIKSFLAESIGEEFLGVITNALDDKTFKNITEYNRRNHH